MRTYRAALVALVIASGLGCGRKEGDTVAPAPPPVVRGATVQTLAAEDLPDLQEAVGTVRARNSAQLAARIPGSVSRVFVREGDRVGRGKVLVSIEAVESGAAAAGAVSGVEEAARALSEAQAQKNLANVTFDRYSRLFAEQAVTRQEYDTRKTEQEVAAQAVARAEARLAQARHGAQAAGAVAGYGRVVSPISGVVVSKQVEAGQTVFPGTPLMTVEGDEGFRLEVAAPESLLGKVRAGDQIGIAVEGAPETGRVSEVVPVVDPATRTFTVKVDLPSGRLRSGSYGKAFFKTGSRKGVSVPAAAVVQRSSLTSVWVVSPEGVARLRLVKPGRTQGGRVEILSGLAPGEKVVTAGIDKMVDGAKVQ
ncbi:efflux RND transporter periplasmic adaptor subunit [Geomonas subterranea]|uniref:Efflux RND transporter periplasmic adaptor subunit n=1 Tax=Geomonas subterranea TaxID=2847989 RepID=A0ABX8LHN9_9BACT|nr:efflux RND transporter periplasmic adaptor subunit [Geomonas subterranea]QXE90252.1 efflux RND transporter periplasmic adaptor subunit [Geomonas subterranea]QXM07622.1 efflux RND transporter periplasmic adaptor subunit [Geomonas subterranea]